MPFVKRENYAQQARDIIEMGIMRGEFKLGEKLVEEKIAQQLNISRVPVREALRVLEKYGLVVVKPNSGTWVISPSAKDIEEVYDIRSLIQPYALELCFKNSPQKTTEDLERQILDFKELLQLKSNLSDLINQQFLFDEIMFLNCGNKKLIEMWEIIVPLLKIGFFHNPYFDEFDNVMNDRQHIEIVLAFKNGRIEEAKKILKDHIDQAKVLICESFGKGEMENSKK